MRDRAQRAAAATVVAQISRRPPQDRASLILGLNARVGNQRVARMITLARTPKWRAIKDIDADIADATRRSEGANSIAQDAIEQAGRRRPSAHRRTQRRRGPSWREQLKRELEDVMGDDTVADPQRQAAQKALRNLEEVQSDLERLWRERNHPHHPENVRRLQHADPTKPKKAKPPEKRKPKVRPKPPPLGSVLKLAEASPLLRGMLILELAGPALEALFDVIRRTGLLEEFRNRVDQLEQGAVELEKGLQELERAEGEMPVHALAEVDDLSHLVVTREELEHVAQYRRAAGRIIKHAGDAAGRLDQAIVRWDRAVAQSRTPQDFTRKPAVEAITLLDLKFSNRGGSFRAYLVATRDRARRLETFAVWKYDRADEILKTAEY